MIVLEMRNFDVKSNWLVFLREKIKIPAFFFTPRPLPL